MTVKLKKQVIDILKVLQNKKSNCVASELAEELKIDYIVLMSAINDLIDQGLGGFKEVEIDQITLNEEGLKYLKNNLPERQIVNIFSNSNIKELSIELAHQKCFETVRELHIHLGRIDNRRIVFLQCPFLLSQISGKIVQFLYKKRAL